MLAEYKEHAASGRTDPRKEKRKEIARARKTAAHLDGDRHVAITTQP